MSSDNIYLLMRDYLNICSRHQQILSQNNATLARYHNNTSDTLIEYLRLLPMSTLNSNSSSRNQSGETNTNNIFQQINPNRRSFLSRIIPGNYSSVSSERTTSNHGRYRRIAPLSRTPATQTITPATQTTTPTTRTTTPTTRTTTSITQTTTPITQSSILEEGNVIPPPRPSLGPPPGLQPPPPPPPPGLQTPPPPPQNQIPPSLPPQRSRRPQAQSESNYIAPQITSSNDSHNNLDEEILPSQVLVHSPPGRLIHRRNRRLRQNNFFSRGTTTTFPNTLATTTYVSSFDSPIRIRPSRYQICQATSIKNYYDVSGETIQIRCPIDLIDFSGNESIMQIRHCGHIFREMNLRMHFRNSPRCPLCRYDIRDYDEMFTGFQSSPPSNTNTTSTETTEQIADNTSTDNAVTENTSLQQQMDLINTLTDTFTNSLNTSTMEGLIDSSANQLIFDYRFIPQG